MQKKIHRFIGGFDFSQPQLNITDAGLVHQLHGVLHLAHGEEIILCNGKGREALVRITEINKKEIIVAIEKSGEAQAEPIVLATLYCAILKREHFELVVQKATEVGIADIVPIITHRTIKLNLRLDRLEKISKGAAEQSGRGKVPVIHELVSFERAVVHAQKNDMNLFFDATGSPVLDALQKTQSVPRGFFVGPEGGWDESEIELAKANGFQIVSLGPLTLRGETAAIIASYLSVS